MNVLRTPDERFENLPGWSYEPRYLDDLPGFAGLRMHYVEEGPGETGETFLCLHGEPTWSYLYRRMIPVFAAAGHRVVAPDFFGFGRSDKPADDAVYTFGFHRGSLVELIERLALDRITLVCQDWGGLLGLTLPMENPSSYERLLIMNTALATGDVPLTDGFLAWRAYAASQPDLAVGNLIGRSCPHLSADECAAYDAPFLDVSFKGGVRRFPELVPDSPDSPGAEISRAARSWLGAEWSGDSFMAVGEQDPVLGVPVMNALQGLIRGCPPPYVMAQAGHFVQEWGEEVAQKALAAWSGGPTGVVG